MSDNSSDRAPINTAVSALSASEASVPVEPEEALKQLESELRAAGLENSKVGQVKSLFMQTLRIHSGPLPSVELFAGYESVCPGAARDILNMAMSQQAHSQKMQHLELIGQIVLKVFAHFSAWFVVVAMLGATVYTAINGHDGVAACLATGSGVALVIAPLVKDHLRRPQQEESQTGQSARSPAPRKSSKKR